MDPSARSRSIVAPPPQLIRPVGHVRDLDRGVSARGGPVGHAVECEPLFNRREIRRQAGTWHVTGLDRRPIRGRQPERTEVHGQRTRAVRAQALHPDEPNDVSRLRGARLEPDREVRAAGVCQDGWREQQQRGGCDQRRPQGRSPNHSRPHIPSSAGETRPGPACYARCFARSQPRSTRSGWPPKGSP